jgi:hypothetical protein
VARACLTGVSRFETREECERTKRAECVAGLRFVEGRISDAAIE